jgi:hypothetical protein
VPNFLQAIEVATWREWEKPWEVGDGGGPDPCRRAGSRAVEAAALGGAKMGAMPDGTLESASLTVSQWGEGVA